MAILDNAARVLQCFSAEVREVTGAELVRQLGIPKSNVSRLLRAMRRAGMLETIGTSKRYRPSPMLVGLALTCRGQAG